MKRVTLLIIVGLLLGTVGILLQAPAYAQGENLLTNPSFEGAYSSYIPPAPIDDCPTGTCSTVQLPAGWQPWWVSQQPTDPDWKNRNPEYKPAGAPFLNRVHGGERAIQYFTFFGTHIAGLWQTATVPANARVNFSIWGQAWSTNDDSPTSTFPTAVNMKVGIDPTGNPGCFGPNVVWSGTANPYDSYARFEVEATAQGDRVTVCTYSAPVEQRKHNDIYWDDAALVVAGAGNPPPPPPSGDGGGNAAAVPAAPPAPVGPTPTPNADGVIIVEIRSGDSLWSVAARAGLTLDELLDLNDLTRGSFINPGDQLIIGYGEPGGAEEAEAASDEAVDAATEEEAAAAIAEAPEAEETRESEPTPEPEPTAEEVSSSICLRAFNDANQNGQFDGSEAPREAVAFTVYTGQQVVSNYVTTGAENEPYCIEGLDPGSYRITRSKLDNEVLTTPGDWAVSIVADEPYSFDFGSYIQEAPAAEAVAAADSVTAERSAEAAMADDVSGALEESGSSNVLVIAVVALAVLLLIGVVFVILSARRSTT